MKNKHFCRIVIILLNMGHYINIFFVSSDFHVNELFTIMDNLTDSPYYISGKNKEEECSKTISKRYSTNKI